tara:strand:+ start:1636 stop:2151 length:516 start_codon:yes stop_codon:yes gene_type:complete
MKNKTDLWYYPFYPKSWLATTNVLDLESKGAYFQIINAIYLNDNVEIYEKHIPNILGINKGKRYNRIMTSIIPFLQVSSEEPLKYTQSKILKVRRAIDKSLEQKSLAGKQSAKVRASNRAKQGQHVLDNRSYGISTNINSNNTIIDKYSTVNDRKEAERKRFNSNMLGNGV